MKNLLKYRIVFIILIMYSTYLSAQTISDEHTLKSYNSSAANNFFKIIRINVHFICRSDGSGNFSENCNIDGDISSENGYWYAETIINSANSYLNNNIEMKQQLSYYSIPNDSINYNYKLNAVLFHKSDSYYEYYGSPHALNQNVGSAVNVYLYLGRSGNGAAGYSSCWIGGIESSYRDYLQANDLWYITSRAKGLNHEIGHILSLDHPKRKYDGTKSVIGGIQYTDNCADTPTFMELINDGYTDPYMWCNGEHSNNMMDYSCVEIALTPCQIDQVHSYIDNVFYNYQCGYFLNSYIQISDFTDNVAYIANTVEVASSSSVLVSNYKKIYIEAQEFLINGEFEVSLGSAFECSTFQ